MWIFLAVLWFYLSTFLIGGWFAFRRKDHEPGLRRTCLSFALSFIGSFIWIGLIWYWLTLTMMAYFASRLLIWAALHAQKR